MSLRPKKESHLCMQRQFMSTSIFKYLKVCNKITTMASTAPPYSTFATDGCITPKRRQHPHRVIIYRWWPRYKPPPAFIFVLGSSTYLVSVDENKITIFSIICTVTSSFMDRACLQCYTPIISAIQQYYKSLWRDYWLGSLIMLIYHLQTTRRDYLFFIGIIH